jgi:hypothetical protein
MPGRRGLHGAALALAAAVDDFVAAVRRVGEGGTALDPEVVAQLVGKRRNQLNALTPRELEVLELVAEGRTNTTPSSTSSEAPPSHAKTRSRLAALPQLSRDSFSCARQVRGLSLMRGSRGPDPDVEIGVPQSLPLERVGCLRLPSLGE